MGKEEPKTNPNPSISEPTTTTIVVVVASTLRNLTNKTSKHVHIYKTISYKDHVLFQGQSLIVFLVLMPMLVLVVAHSLRNSAFNSQLQSKSISLGFG